MTAAAEQPYHHELLHRRATQDLPQPFAGPWPQTWLHVMQARHAASAKHGTNSINDLRADDPRWLSILTEEVGEVARALNYDTAADSNLREELIQVMAVASAWLEALDEPAPDLRPGEPF